MVETELFQILSNFICQVVSNSVGDETVLGKEMTFLSLKLEEKKGENSFDPMVNLDLISNNAVST